MILNKEKFRINKPLEESFASTKDLVAVLSTANEYRTELLATFGIDENSEVSLQIGNSSKLIESINKLDQECEKIDLVCKVRDIRLKNLLEEEKATFEVFSITDSFILSKNNLSDTLLAETRYSAKHDILEYYNLSKFANYCRDNEYSDLVTTIKEYLERKNLKNEDTRKVRLLYNHVDNKFYIRALTSAETYKNFGVNFSVFVALVSLNDYLQKNASKSIFINTYEVDDSNLYVSFIFDEKHVVGNSLSLSVGLILENDEVKRNSVTFNGVFKLEFTGDKGQTELYLKPTIKKIGGFQAVDLLTYPHRGSVTNVFEKIGNLPALIDYFTSQVTEDAKRISSIQHPDDVRKFIIDKVRLARKSEFQRYKEKVKSKLSSITVDNIFGLFELLRNVEELFEHDDIVSLNFWRSKLYEALVEKE